MPPEARLDPRSAERTWGTGGIWSPGPRKGARASQLAQGPLPHGVWACDFEDWRGPTPGRAQTLSKASLSKMLSHSCSRKWSATCAQVGVSRLYSMRVNSLATDRIASAIILSAETMRTPFG